MHSSNQKLQVTDLPNSLIVALVFSFACLWAIWIQPHTIVLRHILLTIGTGLGVYVIHKNYKLFKTWSALPIYLVGLLLVWVTFHLFFLSHQYALQLEEYQTIWKRIAWGAPFAIGLGIAMRQVAGLGLTASKQTSLNQSRVAGAYFWWIFYAGMVSPTAIYLLRAGLMLLGAKWGWHLPEAFINSYPPSTWYIPKTGYVFFCLPALALACAKLIRIFNERAKYSGLHTFLYVITIISVVSVFYLENIKNGIAYSTLLMLTMLVIMFFNRKSQLNSRNIAVAVVILIATTFLLFEHLQKNDSWKTIFADIKVAEQLDQIDSWKYYGARGYPTNELGTSVSGTNYFRAAWAQGALQFIQQMPQGYGLIHESFGHLAREKWPDSRLLQSHSGWLDLTLGIGIPGVLLILLAGGLSIIQAHTADRGLWSRTGIWVLLSIALLMLTTEVSQKTYVDALIFWILWLGALGLR